MSLYKLKFKLRLLFFCIFFLASCATKVPQGKSEVENLFNEASSFIKDERFILAGEKLREVKAKYPYSKYAQMAQLELGNIAFEQENYVEAIIAYQTYKDLYPGNSKIPYVTFRVGESFYKQLPKTHDRDLEEAYQAIAYFDQVIKLYPHSKYYKRAVLGKKNCEQMLLNKEKYIADFYYRTKVYKAARYRYKKIMKEFDDNKVLLMAMERVVLSSLKMKDAKSCKRDAKAFMRVLNKKEQQVKKRLTDLYSQCEAL